MKYKLLGVTANYCMQLRNEVGACLVLEATIKANSTEFHSIYNSLVLHKSGKEKMGEKFVSPIDYYFLGLNQI